MSHAFHAPTARMAFGLIRYLIAIKQRPYFQQTLLKAQWHGHLILNRNRGERIVLTQPDGHQIILLVYDVKDTESQQQVWIGIEAPRHIAIRRPECYAHRNRQYLSRLARTFCLDSTID
ncbi:carbon storage regulator [Pokkaliibacter sp. MBI-7]|uniref:carbon storage regulator n=1 Tax=Pokkaliibacter sp. MBI-7 TaxID=3040600 RepID=UPI0024472580|nr:carbon storage regulator [Pokkaliibacter sp. MBI-7]MDH2434732.1 carbon storage regulator [Pokkaliibacter sp. MBI-7]MDH2436673.1 carbon storage regulator [Pokkaliibacter sp. MBI-7]